MVSCPVCSKPVKEININRHLDAECRELIDESSPPPTQAPPSNATSSTQAPRAKPSAASFFQTPKRSVSLKETDTALQHTYTPAAPSPLAAGFLSSTQQPAGSKSWLGSKLNDRSKRQREPDDEGMPTEDQESRPKVTSPKAKKQKSSNAPLAERMRPQTLDEVAGQSLVGPDGVLRGLIEADRVPSMVLWGGPGTGKTTIARLIAQTAGTRFVEINSTSSGVAECKKLFQEAKNELGLTGRKTIIFCDELHRFSKSQQDVFLAPVESGQVTLIGATTENPSFKVVNALLSRCRTFTLSKLEEPDVFGILKRALQREVPGLPTPSSSPSSEDSKELLGGDASRSSYHLLTDDDYGLVHYLAAFAEGDARTGLNLLELAIDLCQRPNTTVDEIKRSLTQTLVYDRAGDQHYDTISAFHKSVRGSDADATLYYLARMLQSGEDPLYVARRMIVIASEDVGLADNSMLSLATAAYTAAEKVGMPECRINLGHCAVALALAPKSVRAYRGLNEAYASLKSPGVASLPIPLQIRNAPTKLMKELGYGKKYKYNPDYKDGRVAQEYLPEKIQGRKFLGTHDLGDELDPEVAAHAEELHDRELEEEAGSSDVLLNPDGD
ncbi:hypothetical protein MBLNU230_g5972t1 [Neophaeotheca triangularis]